MKEARSTRRRAGSSRRAVFVAVVLVALTSPLPAEAAAPSASEAGVAPASEAGAPPASEAAAAPAPEAAPMSEGRQIVVAYNTGFQWGLSPGVVFSKGQTSFYVGARVGYGFDMGAVLLVPGVHLAGTFSDPSAYLGAPALKVVFPIDSFAPFVEAGAGVGHVDSKGSASAQTGLALLAVAGFMQHFSRSFGLGVEASYQVIAGTGWSAFGLGPIVALAF
jgi:hypothetical protein